jgi:topoisomerase IA-like protein
VWNVRQLGSHPATGEPLAVRKGPYGLYVQAVRPLWVAGLAGGGVGGQGCRGASRCAHSVPPVRCSPMPSAASAPAHPHPVPPLAPSQGDPAQGKGAARNAPLPRGATFEGVTLADAVAALAGPRELGGHPDDGGPVRLHPQGRFGPYISHKTLLAPLPKVRRPCLARSARSAFPRRSFVLALAPAAFSHTRLLNRPRPRTAPHAPPQGVEPADLTLDAAVAAIDAKAARLRARGRDPYPPAPAKGRGKGGKAGAAAAKAKKGGDKGGSSSGGDPRGLNGYQVRGPWCAPPLAPLAPTAPLPPARPARQRPDPAPLQSRRPPPRGPRPLDVAPAPHQRGPPPPALPASAPPLHLSTLPKSTAPAWWRRAPAPRAARSRSWPPRGGA